MLILDEPTNHLDLESREALEAALSEFQGSLLLISHDRALLDAVGSRTVAFEDGTLQQLCRGLARVRPGRVRSGRAEAAAPKPKRKPPTATFRRRRRSQCEAPSRALEREIEQAETALKALEEELADPSAWSTPERTAKSTTRHEAAKRAVEELYAQWERVAG